MNERINELLKQSRTEYWTQYTPSYDYEKFAELFIQECMWQVVKDNQVPHDIQVLIGDRFKEHFGVK